MIKLNCIECNNIFYVSPSRVQKIKCCSKQCSNLQKKITQSGANNPFYGKKHSIESIEKNRKAHLGKEAWNKGKVGIYSEETLEKIRNARAKQTREKHPRWRGGRRIMSGYVYIYSPDHPFKDKQNCVKEHRLIMEKYLNRYLTKQEVVHHINGIKSDNRIENLMLFANNREHILHHSKLGVWGRPPKKSQ